MGIQLVVSSSMEHRFDERLMDAAKKKSLIGFIEGHQIPFFKQTHGHASKYCPNCGLSSDHSNKCNISHELWNCYGCGRGGSVVDYAKYLWQVDAVEAAKCLIGTKIVSAILKPGEISKDEKVEVDLSHFYKKLLATGNTYNKKAFDYLINERCIPEAIITDAVHRGLLIFIPEDPHDASKWLRNVFGDAELKRLGFWKEGKRMPWISFRPMIFVLPGCKSAEWRIAETPKVGQLKSVRFGVDKACWHWKGRESGKVNVVEGPIDMLSMVALGWKGDIKALPGAGCWNDDWLDGYDRAVFTLDNDAAGLKAMETLELAAKAKGIVSVSKAPPLGDVNEELKAKTKKAALKKAA